MRAAGWLLVLSCVCALGSCSRQERNDDCGEATRVVDPVLLAFLSKARSAHHLADQHEAKGDRTSALRALEGLTSGQAPPGSAPEVDEVLADTRARIADLMSQAGRFDQADAELTQGLTHAKTPTYFRGHLFEVRGLVEERREKALRGTGRGQEADKAHERSLDAYEAAMKIQAEVIGSNVAAPAPSAAPRP
jgi:tetratricopeptide (TPR) repeat protein